MTSVIALMVQELGLMPFVLLFFGALITIGEGGEEVVPLQNATVGLVLIITGLADIVIKLWF